MRKRNNIGKIYSSNRNIVNYVSRVVPLQKVGRNCFGICPFHGEKTPSFCVSEPEQRFVCFGCGESGDIVDFAEKYWKRKGLENENSIK